MKNDSQSKEPNPTQESSLPIAFKLELKSQMYTKKKKKTKNDNLKSELKA